MTNHDHDYYHDDCSLCQSEKASSRTCINCKHWEPRDSTDKKQLCRWITSADSDMVYADDCGEPSRIWTSADFFCGLWERE